MTGWRTVCPHCGLVYGCEATDQPAYRLVWLGAQDGLVGTGGGDDRAWGATQF